MPLCHNPYCPHHKPKPDYPACMTGESAFHAKDGPREQAIRELRRIEREARRHGTEAATRLATEACEYLEALDA
jgi:hypothetical protein